MKSRCQICKEEGANYRTTEIGFICEACSIYQDQIDAHSAGEDCGQEDCQVCCEHDDCDDHCCLICGKDMSEDFSSRAEDAADRRADR